MSFTYLTNRLNRPTYGFPVYTGYSTRWELSREEEENLKLIREQEREESARNPFMFRFTLRVLKAIDREDSRIWHQIVRIMHKGDTPEYRRLRERLHAVREVEAHYMSRLAYFEKGECECK